MELCRAMILQMINNEKKPKPFDLLNLPGKVLKEEMNASVRNFCMCEYEMYVCGENRKVFECCYWYLGQENVLFTSTIFL